MSAQILDGKALAAAIKAELTTRVVALKAKVESIEIAKK